MKYLLTILFIYSNLIGSDKDYIELLKGQWISEKYYESSSCGKTGNFKTDSLSLKFNYPLVVIENVETNKIYTYTISEIVNTSYDKVYKNSEEYNDPQSVWGSCGGKIDIPYYDSYIFFKLKDIQSNKKLHLVYSQDNKGNNSFIIDLWSNLDFDLENITAIDQKNEKDIQLISDGYILKKLK